MWFASPICWHDFLRHHIAFRCLCALVCSLLAGSCVSYTASGSLSAKLTCRIAADLTPGANLAVITVRSLRLSQSNTAIQKRRSRSTTPRTRVQNFHIRKSATDIRHLASFRTKSEVMKAHGHTHWWTVTKRTVHSARRARAQAEGPLWAHTCHAPCGM